MVYLKPELEGLSWWSSDYDFAFQCKGWRLDPWLESYDATCLRAKKQKHKAEAIL